MRGIILFAMVALLAGCAGAAPVPTVTAMPMALPPTDTPVITPETKKLELPIVTMQPSITPTYRPAAISLPTATRTITPTVTLHATAIPTQVPTRPRSTATLAPPTAKPLPTATLVPKVIPTVPPVSSGCCKHCGSNSKPCGDSCISLKYTCHKGAGCACP